MKLSERQVISELKEKYNDLLKEAEKLKKVKSQSVESYYSQLKVINDLDDFFKECVQAGKKQLFKEQELVKLAQNNQGETLLYELTRKKDNTLNLKNSAKVDYMQDRHMKTVIYEVIKHIISSAKEQTKNEYISSIKLEWSVFKDMRSLDILALLLLKKNIFDQICSTLFSHPLTATTENVSHETN